MEKLGVYVIITNPQLPYGKIAEICVSRKIKMLQLREKHLSDKETIKIAREIKSITKGSETNLVINDRPDIAVLCDADYLHLGQDDIALEDARKIVGNIPIGLSTHSIEQAQKALLQNPSYIGFGPIYPTNAKAKPDLPVGTKQLEQVIGFSHVPVVAIGGIFPENIEPVLATRASNIALVRYLMQTDELDKRILFLQNVLQQHSYEK